MGDPSPIEPQVQVGDLPAGRLDGVDLDRPGEAAVRQVGGMDVEQAAEDVVPRRAGLLLLVVPPRRDRLDDVADRQDVRGAVPDGDLRVAGADREADRTAVRAPAVADAEGPMLGTRL